VSWQFKFVDLCDWIYIVNENRNTQNCDTTLSVNMKAFSTLILRARQIDGQTELQLEIELKDSQRMNYLTQ